MKTIPVLMMAMVAFAAAQPMIGLAIMFSNDQQFQAVITFIQPNPTAIIKILFSSDNLEERPYLMALHEENGYEDHEDCDRLGEIVKLTAYDTFHRINPRRNPSSGSIETVDIWPMGTLVRHLPHSIQGRAIAIYEEDNERPVVCGMIR